MTWITDETSGAGEPQLGHNGHATAWVKNDNANPVPVSVVQEAAATRAGVSKTGSVDAASAQILAAGAFTDNVMIQNTHASQSLYFSFKNPATASDVKFGPGASITLPFGPNNVLYGIGSAAATTFAAIGA